MTLVALVGLGVNIVTAFILHRSGLEDINTKGAFLHMIADTFSSVAIVFGGLVVSLTGWFIIDPILSIGVALVVGRWSWGLLRDSILILLERRPDRIGVEEIERRMLEAAPEVQHVHDVHVWEITSQYICISAHVVLEDMKLSEATGLRPRIEECLRSNFSIGHVAIQFEAGG